MNVMAYPFRFPTLATFIKRRAKKLNAQKRLAKGEEYKCKFTPEQREKKRIDKLEYWKKKKEQ